VGIPGTGLGFTGGLYNRLQASFTKFIQLPFLAPMTNEDVWVKRKAPNTLVVHAKAGNAFGDLGSYDYFTLGGPHSVRGYAPGELGACRWAAGRWLPCRVASIILDSAS
jgi:hypothetical protein